ncbi:MAG TPA: DUF411 domain-containing protein [Noviherbaspirillum sp.]|uniref:DUF411 domain-containing protein n=1 Tax=Noviherbaspirillum sp. TaxID=1926288 RepID=UPI002D4AE5E8|nr:DUF411 domain-containing protein [Noviherbaspirillum sp.]HYD96520.1 DUF411 domain-containing protein [Noviherbaspirillum sp.]
MQRRSFLQGTLAALLLPAFSARAAQPVIEVYKTPTCGCCHLWVDHLRANGFTVTARDVSDTSPYRRKFGVPEELGSCHTGVVGGYAIEGHVPAQDIKRLLAEKPKAKGLAVPGMPMGSPGMEQGSRKDPYDVMLIQADGRHKVYRHVGA